LSKLHTQNKEGIEINHKQCSGCTRTGMPNQGRELISISPTLRPFRYIFTNTFTASPAISKNFLSMNMILLKELDLNC
jgi:hypothetical protein